MRLNDNIAIVTGAAQGIGRAVAVTFAREGADVIVSDINLELAEKVVDEIRALGRRAQAIKADVSNSSKVNQMVEQAVNNFGRIDILVNNAGVNKLLPSDDLAESDWDWVTGINIKGQFLCSQAVGRQMIKQKQGKIVNIASMAGHYGRPGGLPYCVSKGGVLQLTRTLAVEWAEHNINVNSVTPSLTKTTLWANFGFDVEKQVRKIPLGRMNEPQDIAHAVLFLASSESDNITGQDIIVDGGLCALHPAYLARLD